MAQSRKDPKRKKKLQNFKQKSKKMSEQQQTPKTHLIPQTEWNSKETLDIRGDLMEALEKQFYLTYQHLQQANQEFEKIAQVMQMIFSTNIKTGKVKLKYSWNNGEPATDQEVKNYEAKIAEIRNAQQKQQEDLLKQENALKTGLVGPGGEPIGSTQNLDEPTTGVDTVSDEQGGLVD